MSIYIKPGLRIFRVDIAGLLVEARNDVLLIEARNDVPCEITCVMPGLTRHLPATPGSESHSDRVVRVFAADRIELDVLDSLVACIVLIEGVPESREHPD